MYLWKHETFGLAQALGSRRDIRRPGPPGDRGTPEGEERWASCRPQNPMAAFRGRLDRNNPYTCNLAGNYCLGAAEQGSFGEQGVQVRGRGSECLHPISPKNEVQGTGTFGRSDDSVSRDHVD